MESQRRGLCHRSRLCGQTRAGEARGRTKAWAARWHSGTGNSKRSPRSLSVVGKPPPLPSLCLCLGAPSTRYTLRRASSGSSRAHMPRGPPRPASPGPGTAVPFQAEPLVQGGRRGPGSAWRVLGVPFCPPGGLRPGSPDVDGGWWLWLLAMGLGSSADRQAVGPLPDHLRPRVISSDCLAPLGPRGLIQQRRACCGSRGLSLCLPRAKKRPNLWWVPPTCWRPHVPSLAPRAASWGGGGRA